MSDRTHTPQPKPRDNFRKWDDPAYNDLRRIFSEPKIREVLTHDSFYESARDEAKAEARRKKEEELAEIKKLRDAKRRKSQAEAKARKAANAARAAAKAAKEARPMSAKKRRHLEDKAK